MVTREGTLQSQPNFSGLVGSRRVVGSSLLAWPIQPTSSRTPHSQHIGGLQRRNDYIINSLYLENFNWEKSLNSPTLNLKKNYKLKEFDEEKEKEIENRITN